MEGGAWNHSSWALLYNPPKIPKEGIANYDVLKKDYDDKEN